MRVVLVVYNGTDMLLEKRKIKEHSNAVSLKDWVYTVKMLKIFLLWALPLPDE